MKEANEEKKALDAMASSVNKSNWNNAGETKTDIRRILSFVRSHRISKIIHRLEKIN